MMAYHTRKDNTAWNAWKEWEYSAAEEGEEKKTAEHPYFQDFIFVRELSEVYLLMDHISGRWDKNFIAESSFQNDAKNAGKAIPGAKPHDDHTPWDSSPDGAAKAKAEQDWIEEICEIGWPSLSKSRPERAHQAALLMLAKDRLNAAAKPASGMTVAFTLMVSGYVPADNRRRSKPGDNAKDNNFYRLPSRTSLARTAFPGLVSVARTFKFKIKCIVGGLCAVLLLTCMLSWDMTSGYAILSRLDALQLKKESIELKIAEAERQTYPAKNTLAPTGLLPVVASESQAPLVRFCDRPNLLPHYLSPDKKEIEQFGALDEIHLCDASKELARELENSRTSLSDWLYGWRWSNFAYQRRVKEMEQTPAGMSTAPGGGFQHWKNDSDEEWARIFVPLLLNSVLPFFYGILGAGASVVRHLRMKTKESLLSPRDISLAMNQMVLGATIGGCIGLFVAQSTNAVPGVGFVGVAGLTGSALSFVAGFGVEGVFATLESIVKRLFNLQDTTPKT